MASANSKTLYRLPRQGKIAGVCAGMAEYFDFDLTLMRVIWVIIAFASGGMAVLFYILLAIILPVSENDATKDISDNNTEDIKSKVHRLGKDLDDNGALNRGRNYLGATFIIVGGWFLLARIMPDWIKIDWNYVWPIALIIVGLAIIFRSGNHEKE